MQRKLTIKYHWNCCSRLTILSFAKSPNGWTDMDIALEWLRRIFNPQTKDKAAGRKRVLLLDGHNSHFSLNLLEYCIENHIIVICYPAHCTHALQGLDVACFAKMKHIWHAELDEYYQIYGKHVNKQTYARVFGTAFLKAFDRDTILAAFRATGVHPYDPTVITEQQMKPSEVTSTRTTFPLKMSSPVRRVMAVFHHQPATAFEQDLDTYQPSTSTEPLPLIAAPPVTPKRRRLDPDESQLSSDSNRNLQNDGISTPPFARSPPIDRRDLTCKNMRYLFSFDLIPHSVTAPSSISGLLHHMPYF